MIVRTVKRTAYIIITGLQLIINASLNLVAPASEAYIWYICTRRLFTEVLLKWDAEKDVIDIDDSLLTVDFYHVEYQVVFKVEVEFLRSSAVFLYCSGAVDYRD